MATRFARNAAVKFVPPPRLVGVEPNPGPPKKTRLSDADRWRIVLYHNDLHWSNKKIATFVQCNEHTVHEVLERHHEGLGIGERAGRGRKRKISKTEGKQMAKDAEKGRFVKHIQREFKKSANKEVSYDTVRRTLARQDMEYKRFKKVDLLTEDNIKQRLKYATKMKEFSYKPVLFTDEKLFPLTFVPQGAWVKRGSPSPQKAVAKYPLKINVWGGVGYYFKTKLYFFDGTMNAELYQDALKECLFEDQLIFAADCPQRLKEKWYFLQDGAKVHKTKDSMALVKELVGSKIIDHPAMSPDFNVIEDVWSYLVRQLEHCTATNIPDYVDAIRREWDEMDWSVIRKSVDSMPRRLLKCIELQGKRTGY